MLPSSRCRRRFGRPVFAVIPDAQTGTESGERKVRERQVEIQPITEVDGQGQVPSPRDCEHAAVSRTTGRPPRPVRWVSRSMIAPAPPVIASVCLTTFSERAEIESCCFGESRGLGRGR